MTALTHTPDPGPLARISAFAQLGKLRVYQHFYEWLLVVALLVHAHVERPGMAVALAAALLAMFALQACACAIDDIVGFRNGSDAANYVSAEYPSGVTKKPLLTGALTVRAATVFAGAAALVTAVCGIGVGVALGGHFPASAMAAAFLACVVATQYVWGLRLSYRPGGLDTVILLINAGTVVIPFWLIARYVDATVVMVAALIAVWFLIFIAYGNASDRDGDAAAGRRTLAVVLPPRVYRMYLLLLYVATVALALLPFLLGHLRGVLVLCVLPVIAVHTVQVWQGVGRGRTGQAMLIGMRAIDVGGIGMAVAILLSR
ncbi:UbiA family prenyltransferase [Nocardia takedensis]